MYDAIIVGARCAGSPLALLLARKGYRVLALDRTQLTNDVISTHFVVDAGVSALDRWGVLDEVSASGAATRNPRQFIKGHAMPAPPPEADRVGAGLCPRRTVLDTILANAARAAGADVRENVSVRELLIEDGVVKGIRGMSATGQPIEETATIVVGADGENSLVARQAGAAEYNTKPGLTCGFYSYFSGVEAEYPELHVLDNRAFFIFPTSDDLVCLASEWPADRFAEFKSDAEGNLLRTLDLAPDLGKRARAGKREEDMRGKLIGHSFYRQAYGPGWALTGDARYHKDPVLGQGITDAFLDSERLAQAIDEGLSNTRPMDEALAAYQQQRDAETAGIYEFTAIIASLDPPDEIIQMMAGGPPPQAEAVS